MKVGLRQDMQLTSTWYSFLATLGHPKYRSYIHPKVHFTPQDLVQGAMLRLRFPSWRRDSAVGMPAHDKLCQWLFTMTATCNAPSRTHQACGH
jgi:hypothetical protein